MKPRRIASLAFALILTAASVQGQSKITLKIASVAPARSPWDIEQRALAQEWNKITGGLVNIVFFDATALGGEKGVIQKFRSVRPGQKAPLDGVIFTTIGMHELAPAASLYTYSMPFLIRSQGELDFVFKAHDDRLKKAFRDAGFESLAWTNVGWLSFYTKDRFANLDELKKIKIASAGLDSPILGDTFRAGGFNIEDIQAAKLLQALKGGNLRGFFGVHMYAYVTGFSKTISWALDTKLCPVMAGVLLSNEAWAQIPAQYHPEMREAIARMKVRLDAALEDTDRAYMQSMIDEGVKPIRPTEAELADWEAKFNRDIEIANKTAPGAFDMKLYGELRSLLSTYRDRE